MFIAIDVGNTQTTAGLFDDGGTLMRQWRMATDRTDTADELHERMYGYFQMFGLDLRDVSDVAIASVVPILSTEWRHMMREVVDTEPLMVSARRDCGIEVGMPDPYQVGADRIANALSAKERYGAPVIVVDFGTATNIDVVDARGAFRGGAIMAGVVSSAGALFERAAQLASVPLVMPERALGDSTETAVQSGMVLGAACQVEGLVARVIRELREETPEMERPTVVATGGFANEIARATDIFDAIDPDLTIRGIYQIWRHRALKRARRLAARQG